MDAIKTIKVAGELAYWMQVDTLVPTRYKEARPVKERVQKLIRHLPVADPGYGYVFWHPEKKNLWVVLSDGDDQAVHNKWANTLKAVQGVNSVTTEAEAGPPDRDDWIMIKKAAPLGLLNKPYEWAGKLTGGPSPITNAVVSGLLTGGLGYGTGWLLEHLFPERYVRRGRLRKTLGLLGAGLGAAPGVWQGVTAYNQSAEAGKPLGWKAAITPTNEVPISPKARTDMQNLGFTSGPAGARYDEDEGKVVTSEDIAAMYATLPNLPPAPERFVRAAHGLLKEAFDPNTGAGGVGLRPVPMDAFNRAVWNDVRMGMTASQNPFGTKSPWGDNKQQLHTPPQLGAATSGLLSGIRSMYGGRSVLSPMHFIRGLATAGVDLATSRIVGGTLGALGGLTPEAQKKLQDFGMWGGLIRGTVGSMLR